MECSCACLPSSWALRWSPLPWATAAAAWAWAARLWSSAARAFELCGMAYLLSGRGSNPPARLGLLVAVVVQVLSRDVVLWDLMRGYFRHVRVLGILHSPYDAGLECVSLFQ